METYYNIMYIAMTSSMKFDFCKIKIYQLLIQMI